MEKEIWRPVKGFIGLYEVSNTGKVKSLKRNVICKNGFVRSIKERILSPGMTKAYLIVCLFINKKSHMRTVHRLVAESFLNHKPNGVKVVVDHIDNNALNNNLSNLQLISNRLNLTKDKKGGTSKYVGVYWKKDTKKWVTQINIGGKLYYLGSFDNEQEASKKYQDKLKSIL